VKSTLKMLVVKPVLKRPLGITSCFWEELNVVVEWLALLLPTREVPGSNLGPETNLTEFFVVFLSTSRNFRGSTFN
jgi:hypothetical protein